MDNKELNYNEQCEIFERCKGLKPFSHTYGTHICTYNYNLDGEWCEVLTTTDGDLAKVTLKGKINGLEELKSKRDETVAKWKAEGFLDGLNGAMPENVAQLFESRAYYIIGDDGDIDYNEHEKQMIAAIKANIENLNKDLEMWLGRNVDTTRQDYGWYQYEKNPNEAKMNKLKEIYLEAQQALKDFQEDNEPMTIKDRELIFEEFGFKYHSEFSHGLALYEPEYGCENYIIAKPYGTWDWFNLISAETPEEAIELSRKDHEIGFRITSRKQLRIILESLM